MCEEGVVDEATRDKDWIDYANQLYDGREPIDEYERLKRIVNEPGSGPVARRYGWSASISPES